MISLVGILKYQEYYEWLLKKDVKDAYLALCKGGLCWCEGGLVRITHSVVMELFPRKVIEVDVPSKRVLRVNGWKVNGIEHNQVLDLSDDGERWEGDVLNNQPYGWGVYYDSENRMVYEGFRIGEVNVCYGRSYYPDVGVIEYEGMIFEGKRWGRGVQYDKRGVVTRYGEWVNNEPAEMRVTISDENPLLFTCVEELIVSDECCNGREWKVFDVSCIVHLRELKVGDECFERTEELKLVGLNHLQRVVIGESSFTKMGYDPCEDKMDPNRHFYLKNCPRLRELKIGCGSFSDYSVCEIENVNRLTVIKIGELHEGTDSFWYASLELRSVNVDLI